jgi:hypothetical protein
MPVKINPPAIARTIVSAAHRMARIAVRGRRWKGGAPQPTEQAAGLPEKGEAPGDSPRPAEGPAEIAAAPLVHSWAGRYFAQTQRIWNILFVTLPLDALLLLLARPLSPLAPHAEWLNQVIIILLLSALALTPQEFWLTALAEWRAWRQSRPNLKNRVSWALVIVFMILGLFELFVSASRRRSANPAPRPQR